MITKFELVIKNRTRQFDSFTESVDKLICALEKLGYDVVLFKCVYTLNSITKEIYYKTAPVM